MEDFKKENNVRVFKAADFFMIRSPLLPIKVYDELFNNSLSNEELERRIFKLANESVIRDAISASSLSLNEALESVDFKKDDKKRKQILSSLLKYIIRITTRTTPYGLFSGVTMGCFSDNTDIKLDNKNKHVRRTRPDMEWLYAIIREIENDEQILSELHVRANDLAVVNGSRLDIGYISNYGQTSKDDLGVTLTASVRYSSQVQFVMNIAKEPIKFGDLLSIIQSNNPSVSQERIKSFLNQLLKNEYIITEMRPPLINIAPFDYVISKLKNIKCAEEIYLKLLNIKELIDKYDACPIGGAKVIHKDIINNMKALKEYKDYLQVDLRLKENKAILNHKIAEELENVMEILLRITNEPSQPYHFKKYMEDFIEKYGTYREISIIELLDADRGLGAPAGYSKPESNRYIEAIPQNYHDKKIYNYLLNKVVQALINNNKEVVITDEDINILEFKKLNKYISEELPKSLEVNILIAAENSKAIDNGEFTIFLGPNVGSGKAGKTFGRFTDILPTDIHDKFIEFKKHEKKITKHDVIFAEIVELPQSGRVSNISMNCNPQDYEVVISTNCSDTKEKISISDLYVGISEENDRRFYIKSKSLNKKVILTNTHMLNMLFGSNLYRFLREVSECSTVNITDKLYYNGLSSLNYTPRIKYGKVVLFPSTWNLSEQILDMNFKKIDKTIFYNSIKSWRDKWKVPKFVYLKESDNRLLLNLENKLHLDELMHLFQISPTRNLILTELEGEFGDVWVEGEGGNYCSEMVVPILLNDEFLNELKKNKGKTKELEVLKTKSTYISNAIELNTFDKERCFLPGDEWLYLKLYGNSKRVDEFIAYEMLPFCEKLVKDMDIEKFFFIRYVDTDEHIRLRLKGNKKHLYLDVIPKLNEWFYHLIECGLLSRITFDTYVRESERYGGNELIDLAEDVFYRDSLFVGNIINLKRSGQVDLDLKQLAVSSIINLMEELKIDYDTQKELFMHFYDKNSYRELFKKDRRTFLKISDSSNNWLSLEEVQGGTELKKLFEIRKQSLNLFSDKMNWLDEKNKLCNSKLDIILSLIHMFCNRLVASSQFEQTVMCLVRHTLQSLEYVKKD